MIALLSTSAIHNASPSHKPRIFFCIDSMLSQIVALKDAQVQSQHQTFCLLVLDFCS